MRMRAQAVLACLLMVTLLSALGCITKRRYRQDADSVDSRIATVETGLEANERRIEDLKGQTDRKLREVEEEAERALRTGREASDKAVAAQELADRAAKGRLLWTLSLTDDNITFGFERAELSEEAKAKLDDLIAKIKAYGKAIYIEIEGHTDSSGPEEYNMILGEKRAEAVRAYLNKVGGIPLHAISTISYGESQPVADNSTREGRARNRRVVIKVLE